MITLITWKLYLLKKTTKLSVFVLLKVSTNHCVQASWRWQITLWIWGNKKTGILNSMFNLPTVCGCVCVGESLLFDLDIDIFLFISIFWGSTISMISVMISTHLDTNAYEMNGDLSRGSIEPQRCSSTSSLIFLELRNPLIFLGACSKDKRNHSNSAWVTTDTLCPFISKERQVFLERHFAKNEDWCLQRLKITLAL